MWQVRHAHTQEQLGTHDTIDAALAALKSNGYRVHSTIRTKSMVYVVQDERKKKDGNEGGSETAA